MEKITETALMLSMILNIYLFGFHTPANTQNPSPQVITQVVEAAQEDDWDVYIMALAWVESRWDDNAVGNKNDVGYLQITPVIVKDANRIVGYEKFSLNDRTDRGKSIEIFNVIQQEYNPEHDMNLGLKVWNSKAPVAYHKRVMSKYRELCQL